jgi:hypothetical protein
MSGLMVLLADPTVQAVLYALAGIVIHKYFPFLDSTLNKLPGTGTPAAKSILEKLTALEDKLHQVLNTPKG